MVCIKNTAFPLEDVGLKEQIPLEISCTKDVVTWPEILIPLSTARNKNAI